MKPRHNWDKGLSSEQAAAILRRHGYNELPSTKTKSIFIIAIEVVREPMFLLLLAASLIYLFLGDFREAIVLLLSVFGVMGITFFQQRKTERALEALRDLSSPRALVIRDGQAKRIAGREVVKGDILLLKEGDRVPADAMLLVCNNLAADESLLTGESLPVTKRSGGTEEHLLPPGGNDMPFVYSGTLLTQGQGTAIVVATGLDTEIGKIGRALDRLKPEQSSIQKEIRRAIIIFATIGITLCVIVTVIYGVMRDDWLNGILAGITLAIANLPEEFPVVLTVFLALGAWRISRQGVLTRQPPAIETLGATTVLCVDKTGTLTQNRMTIRQLSVDNEKWVIHPGREQELPETFHELLEYGILASEIEPFDPMERAFLSLGRNGLDAMHDHKDWQIIHEYPFASELPAHAHIWSVPDRDYYVAATKGAPEAIAEICGLPLAERTLLLEKVAAMAKQGLRVLAVAKTKLPLSHGKEVPWPSSQKEIGFTLIGLVGLEDPIRPTVPDAIKECYSAGIRIVMITGDYPGTASAIAMQIGLSPADKVMTGIELAHMSDEELANCISHINIFARVAPEQKLRIVQALKTAGEVVAMTGDGVNDAPALKAAHIGVAMGTRGTDVAREAASLVLIEDDFASLVHAVRLGRRIFDNIQKAICYIVAVHVPTAGLALLPLLFGWPLVLYPVHVVFLEFVIDPACSIVFEAETAEDNVMRRPPRLRTSRLFNGRLIAISIIQGLGVLIVAVLFYAVLLVRHTSEDTARALVFTTLVMANLGLIFINRSHNASLLKTLRRPNSALWWIVSAALTVLGLVLFVEPMREIFRFGTVNFVELSYSFLSALIAVGWYEIYKVVKLRIYPMKTCTAKASQETSVS